MDTAVKTRVTQKELASIRKAAADAKRRFYIERLQCRLKWVLIPLCVATYALLGIVVWTGNAPSIQNAVYGIFAGLLLICCLTYRLPAISSTKALSRVDKLAGLPDTLLAASEVSSSFVHKSESEEPVFMDCAVSFWTAQIQNKAAQFLKRQPIAAIWRIERDGVFIFGCTALPLLVLLTSLYSQYMQAISINLESLNQSSHHLLQDISTELADELESIEEALQSLDTEEVKAVKDEIRTARDALENPEITRQDAFIALNRVEQQLKALREKAQTESWDNQSESLAEAMASLESGERSAAAMRQKDYKQLAEELEKLAKKANEQKPENLSPNRERSATKMKEAAQQMQDSGHQQAAQALSEMSQGMQENKSSQLSEGAQQLSQQAMVQHRRQQANQSMANQLSNLKDMKESLAQGRRPSRKPGSGARGQPGPGQNQGQQDGQQGGLMAGAADHDQPFGKSTHRNSPREDTQLAGTLGEGMSAKTTIRTDEPGDEGLLAPSRFGQPGDSPEYYENLQKQALENESMPLSRREAIRQYFQRIRPATQ